jgi:hypothetical protein
MLSLSAEASNTDIDLQIVNGDGSASSDVPHSAALMRFAESVASRDPQAIAAARQALFDAAGNDVVVDAAAVAGNFQRMVRIADSTGIPVDERMNALSGSIQSDLNLRRFGSAQNTPLPSLLERVVNVPKGLMMRRMVKLLGRR